MSNGIGCFAEALRRRFAKQAAVGREHQPPDQGHDGHRQHRRGKEHAAQECSRASRAIQRQCQPSAMTASGGTVSRTEIEGVADRAEENVIVSSRPKFSKPTKRGHRRSRPVQAQPHPRQQRVEQQDHIDDQVRRPSEQASSATCCAPARAGAEHAPGRDRSTDRQPCSRGLRPPFTSGTR